MVQADHSQRDPPLVRTANLLGYCFSAQSCCLRFCKVKSGVVIKDALHCELRSRSVAHIVHIAMRQLAAFIAGHARQPKRLRAAAASNDGTGRGTFAESDSRKRHRIRRHRWQCSTTGQHPARHSYSSRCSCSAVKIEGRLRVYGSLSECTGSCWGELSCHRGRKLCGGSNRLANADEGTTRRPGSTDVRAYTGCCARGSLDLFAIISKLRLACHPRRHPRRAHIRAFAVVAAQLQARASRA